MADQLKRNEHGQFLPGVSGNPSGNVKGTRHKLNADFLNTLAEDFREHGKSAIKECREQDPAAYVRALAGLLPKEIEVKPALSEFEDHELIAAVRALQSFLAPAGTDAGAGAAGEPPKAH